MNTTFKLGDFEIIWLKGGAFQLDGGAMFGVVPKILWSKKIVSDDENYIPLTASPILVKTPDALILIESGLGNKLDEKQRMIFRLREEWHILEDLKEYGLTREDIGIVVLSHYDWDHAAGVVMRDGGDRLSLTFPKARHVIQKTEWEDVLNPNKRSKNTYWPVNYEPLRNSSGNLELAEEEKEIVKGIKVLRTGGHTRGHQIILLESRGQRALYMADLFPIHAQFNPLWVTAYDNFPLDSISEKERWQHEGITAKAWFLFYHDPLFFACKFDDKGNVVEEMKR